MSCVICFLCFYVWVFWCNTLGLGSSNNMWLCASIDAEAGGPSFFLKKNVMVYVWYSKSQYCPDYSFQTIGLLQDGWVCPSGVCIPYFLSKRKNKEREGKERWLCHAWNLYPLHGLPDNFVTLSCIYSKSYFHLSAGMSGSIHNFSHLLYWLVRSRNTCTLHSRKL